MNCLINKEGELLCLIIYRGDLNLADYHFDKGDFVNAQGQYKSCLRKELNKAKKNINLQKIKYCEMQINRCIKYIEAKRGEEYWYVDRIKNCYYN